MRGNNFRIRNDKNQKFEKLLKKGFTMILNSVLKSTPHPTSLSSSRRKYPLKIIYLVFPQFFLYVILYKLFYEDPLG